ncbi:MAG TPA: hypothetical protein VNA89_08925, partial [Gemmatimonadaceae bacterium]|nr:hypothetical protein [Gemmatimonadaceae bacterium]
KHGVVADEGYFDFVREALPSLLAADGWAGESMTELVAVSARIKAEVVSRDERESGLRKVLNCGHTLGHAIEAASGYALLHGEAVAIGMALESALAERAGVAAAGTADRVREAVAAAGLPATRPRELDVEVILGATRADKKARRGTVEYALPTRVGEMAGADAGWAVRVGDELVREVLA